MNTDRKIKISALTVAFAFFCALTVLGVCFATVPPKIVKGVSVQGEDLSGLTREDGMVELKRLEREKIFSVRLVLRYGNREWTLRPEDIGLVVDTDRILDEAFSIGRRGSALDRWRQRQKAGREGIHIPLYVKVDRNMLDSKLDADTSQITVIPQDAQIKINPDETVEVIPSRDGVKVDGEKVYRDITALFQNDKSDYQINLSLIKLSPGVTTKDIKDMGIDGLLSSYTTTFSEKDADRSYNIKIASASLDGLLIPPADIFSFNDAVGSRSTEAGYKNAKVIVNNELVDGPGGGVCQVSTTLYNAVLLANMRIVDRSSHSMPVSYVPLGRDATVAYKYIDFKFENSTPNFLYLKSCVNNGRITIKLYGNSKYRRQIYIRTKILEKIPFQEVYEQDPTLGKGEVKLKREGSPGLKVESERVLLEDGRTIVENLSDSFYRPLNQIVLTGPGVEPIGAAAGTSNKISGQANSADDGGTTGGIVPPGAE